MLLCAPDCCVPCAQCLGLGSYRADCAKIKTRLPVLQRRRPPNTLAVQSCVAKGAYLDDGCRRGFFRSLADPHPQFSHPHPHPPISCHLCGHPVCLTVLFSSCFLHVFFLLFTRIQPHCFLFPLLLCEDCIMMSQQQIAAKDCGTASHTSGQEQLGQRVCSCRSG